MAKVKKAKVKKAEQSTRLPLDDMRQWRPVAGLIERLLAHIGNKNLVAHDLNNALANGKIRCMRRSIRMSHADVDKLCDTELKRQILGDEPSAAEDFSELLHGQLFEPFTRVRASHKVVTPKLIIAAMGGDTGMILVNGITLGQYVERLAAEANLKHTPGHHELVPTSFWATHCLVCSPNGDIGVGFRFPPKPYGPSEPSSTLTASWAFFLREPDCVKVWPALAPQAVVAREVDPNEPPSPRRKPGRKPRENWKVEVVTEVGLHMRQGKPIPSAKALADFCRDQLEYEPDISEIQKLLRHVLG
jgi:hypothetical protein